MSPLRFYGGDIFSVQVSTESASVASSVLSGILRRKTLGKHMSCQ